MPIQNNFKVEAKESGALPKDDYTAQLIDVNVAQSENFDKTETIDVFEFLFALLDEPYRGRRLSYRYVPIFLYVSKKGKNKLYTVIEGLLGRDLSEEEVSTMDAQFINNLIGKQTRLVVEVNDKGNNAIEGFLKVKGDHKLLLPSEIEKILKDDAEMKAKFAAEDAKKSQTSDVRTFDMPGDTVTLDDVR